jgi:hypothetical protein
VSHHHKKPRQPLDLVTIKDLHGDQEMAHNKTQPIPIGSEPRPGTPDAFRKAVQAVHSKPRSPLTLLQRKLGNAWLKHAIESQPDAQGWWELSIRDLSQTIGFDSNNRQYLKEAAEALMAIVFEWDVMALASKRIHWKASVMFPELEIRSGVIRYQISSQMRERMLNPDMYAMIDMNVVRQFKRAPALAIWEFCIRFEKLGQTGEVSWMAFRDMILGESADGKTYQEYKYFKSKVLLPSIEEVSTVSGHQIALVETKIGRRIDKIRFTVVRKTKVVEAEASIESTPDLDLLSDLEQIGFSRLDGRRLLEQHSAAALAQALSFTRKRMANAQSEPLTQPAAYFRTALTQGYAKIEAFSATTPASPASEHRSSAEPMHERPAIMATLQDSRDQMNRQRAARVIAYLQQLPEPERQSLVHRYNAGQSLAVLRITSRTSRLAEASFQRWLANDLWGEPSIEDVFRHGQNMLAAALPV